MRIYAYVDGESHYERSLAMWKRLHGVSAPPNHTRPRGRPRWSRRGRGTSPHRPLTPFGLGATARATRPAIAPPQGDFQPAARTRAQCGASRPSARRPRGGQRTILAVAAVRGSRAKMGRPARCSRLARRRAPRLDPAGTRSPHAPCRFFSLLGSAHPRSAAHCAGWLRGHGLADDSWPGGQRGGGDVTLPRP